MECPFKFSIFFTTFVAENEPGEMNRLIILLLLFAVLAPVVNGQTDTLVINIDEVVVMENRIQAPLSLSPSTIEIIPSELTGKLPANSVQGLLQMARGVDIRQRGPMGVQSDISVRGGSFDQVAVLIDGIGMNDPQTGHHIMNLPVDLSVIDHIEVFKGPSSRVFGQNALTGAINIVTRVPANNYIRASATAGDWGLAGAGIASSFRIGPSRHYLSARRDRSSGYRYNTDFRINNIYYRSSVKTGAGDISISAGLSSRDFGANGFYASPDYTDQYERVTTSFAAVEFSPAVRNHRLKLTNRVWYRSNADEYIFLRHDPSYYRNLHLNQTGGIETNLSWTNRAGITGFGVNLTGSGISSSRLGEHGRLSSGVFLEHRFLAVKERLIIRPGLQFNWYSDFGSAFLPGVDAGFRISKKLMIYTGAGYTYRIPTYTDLYYEDPVNSGNPELKPEYALSAESGVRFTGDGALSASAALFTRHGVNIIDRIKYTETDKWTPENIASTQVSGFEAGFTLRPGELRILNGSWVSYLTAGYTWMFTDHGNLTVPFSKFAFENLRNQVTGTIRIDFPWNIYQVVTYRYCNRVNLEDYSVMDTRMGYDQGWFSLFADITNIFDRSYRETNLVQLPGRWFSAGITVEIPTGRQ